ncbi:MAG: sulfurtransferase TusA family protein [Rhodospirillales bacterium]|nr:sulfurtransferase TusA family protein [Rhodospirillales bacterium]
MTSNNQSAVNHHFIDITGEVCPMTFVKTKLLLEKIPVGAILEVRLRGKEPLANVPRSLREHHHKILSLQPEDPGQGEFATHRLLVEKT